MTTLDKIAFKRALQRQAEADGQVADSMEVRKALMARYHSGEITLVEAHAQLKKIQAGAKRSGLITRSQAYNGRVAPSALHSSGQAAQTTGDQ